MMELEPEAAFTPAQSESTSPTKQNTSEAKEEAKEIVQKIPDAVPPKSREMQQEPNPEKEHPSPKNRAYSCPPPHITSSETTGKPSENRLSPRCTSPPAEATTPLPNATGGSFAPFRVLVT